MSRRLFFIISSISLFLGITAYALAQEKTQDSVIENPSPYSDILPESYRVAILSADSVEWMIIDGWTPNDSSVSRLGEPIGEILCSHLSKDSVANDKIRDLLLSPSLFQNDTIVKECTYIPDFGVMFIAETDSLIVSYSSYCDMCRFQSKDGFWDFDGTSIRDELYRLLKAEFPKDKYVRNITRRL